jgi:hypothetical protein
MLSMEHIFEAMELAIRFMSPSCEIMMSGDSSGLLRHDPSVLLTMKICRVSRFCQTAFSSVDGARSTMLRRLALLNGVLVRSGVQLTVGLLRGCPFGSIVRRNSVSVSEIECES